MIRIFGHYIPIQVMLLLCLEGITLILSIYLGVSIRFDVDLEIPDSLDPMAPKAWAFTLILIVSMLVLSGYRSTLREDLRAIVVRLFMAFGLGLGIMSLMFYVVPSLYVGRGVLSISIVMAFFSLLLLRLAFFNGLHSVFSGRGF